MINNTKLCTIFWSLQSFSHAYLSGTRDSAAATTAAMFLSIDSELIPGFIISSRAHGGWSHSTWLFIPSSSISSLCTQNPDCAYCTTNNGTITKHGSHHRTGHTVHNYQHITLLNKCSHSSAATYPDKAVGNGHGSRLYVSWECVKALVGDNNIAVSFSGVVSTYSSCVSTSKATTTSSTTTTSITSSVSRLLQKLRYYLMSLQRIHIQYKCNLKCVTPKLFNANHNTITKS